MSSVFAMLMKQDGPVFMKGDIVTGNQDSDYFGDKIRDNPKFKILEVLDITMVEAVTLLDPIIDANNDDEVIFVRAITVDVDFFLDIEQTTKDVFLSKLTRKVVPVEILVEEVIV